MPKAAKVRKGGGKFKFDSSVGSMLLKVLAVGLLFALVIVITVTRLGFDFVMPVRGRTKHRKNTWHSYDNCNLIGDGEYSNALGRTVNGQDGDSFTMKCPFIDKERPNFEKEARLYLVDAPETKVKHYGRGKSNQARVEDQARYFG